MITFFQNDKNMAPSHLENLIPPSVNQVSQRNLRNYSGLPVPRSRTYLYDKCFIPVATTEWNSLPENMKSCTSLASFKHLLYQGKNKVPNTFTKIERNAQVFHARLRTWCRSLNADLYNNHISEKNTCSCCQPEAAEHFPLNCNIYSTLRREPIYTISI